MAYYLDLYLGDPTTTGVSVLATITGSASRQDVTSVMVDSPYYGGFVNSLDIVVAAQAAANCNVSYVALYDAASGGVLLKSAPIGAHYSVQEKYLVQFPALALFFPT